MRVITGSARGLTLSAPKAEARPTMDRVRAAIFSTLGDAVPGARVLDLFAGSGALGIEALSRGAASATFVDSSRAADRCIRANLSRARLTGTVICGDAFRFIETAGEAAFDLIFADPPYAKKEGDPDHARELAARPALARILAGGGTLVIECPPSRVPEAAPGFVSLGSRKYGSSGITYFVRA